MKKYLLILLAAFSILFISCNSEGIGIFYKISIEQPLSTSELSEKSVYKIVSDGTDTFVLAGAVVYKEIGSEWDPISAPSGKIQAVSLASDGTTIYSVYADDSISSPYKLSGSSWISVPGAGALDVSNDLILIEGDNSYIFICQETKIDQYNIWAYDIIGSSLNDISLIDIDTPVIAASILGANYYLISSNYSAGAGNSEIYTTDGIVNISALSGATTGFDYTKALGDIISNVSDLYISTRDGNIYSSGDGTNWSQIDSGIGTVFGPLEIVTFGTTDYLIIGTNNGYLEMDLSGTSIVTPTATSNIDIQAVGLGTEMIHSIYSSSNDSFFIGSQNGLWYNNAGDLDLK